MTSITIFGALLFTEIDNALGLRWKAELIVWGLGFSALCVWQSTHQSHWSANRICEYLGERSYSLYLFHPAAIILLIPAIQDLYNALTPHFGAYAFFDCSTAFIPLLMLTEATYRLIEVPCIRLGRGISNRIRANDA